MTNVIKCHKMTFNVNFSKYINFRKSFNFRVLPQFSICWILPAFAQSTKETAFIRLLNHMHVIVSFVRRGFTNCMVWLFIKEMSINSDIEDHMIPIHTWSFLKVWRHCSRTSMGSNKLRYSLNHDYNVFWII